MIPFVYKNVKGNNLNFKERVIWIFPAVSGLDLDKGVVVQRANDLTKQTKK